MFKEFSNNKDDDYLSEFRQKIASERQAQIQARKQEIQRTRNGFLGTIAGIALAGIVSWFLLVPSFQEEKDVEIPVIRRPVAPVKIQPNDPGGMQILNQDKAVYGLVEKHEVENVKVESILPVPEAPKLPEIVPEPEEQKEVIENSEKDDEIKTDENALKGIDELIEKVETTDGKKITIPQKPTDIKLEVKTVKEVKEVKDVKEVKEVKTEATVEVKKEEKPQIKETKALPEKEKVVETKGTWQLQLIASANIEAVKNAWAEFKSKHSSLKDLNHEIESSDVDGKQLHRLRVGAFETKEKAEQFCANLKKEGLNCILKQK